MASKQTNRYAVLICARNEENVIGALLDSLHAQTYPAERLKLFVLADNCTDHTADEAQSHGARVFSRLDTVKIGKGYALETLLWLVDREEPAGFDGYFVFDADNTLDKDFIAAMDRRLASGEEVVTGFRLGCCWRGRDCPR